MDALWTGLVAAVLTVVILGAIPFIFKTWTGTLIARSIGHSFDLKLEQFKNDIKGSTDQILALQSAGNTVLAEGQRVAAERRIKAIDTIWCEILRLKHETSLPIKMLDLADDSNEHDVLLRDASLKLSQSQLLEKYWDIALIERERLFVGVKVFALCQGYMAIVVRMVHTLAHSVEIGRMNLWHEDEHALGIVRKMLTSDEMEEFEDCSPGHAVWTTTLIEGKILENLRRLIAGAQSVDEGVELAREILKSTSQLTETSRRDAAP